MPAYIGDVGTGILAADYLVGILRILGKLLAVLALLISSTVIVAMPAAA